MPMTKKVLTLFLLLCTLPLGIVFADDDNSSTNGNLSTDLTIKNPNGRPNAPARYHILCEYDAHTLTFTLPPFVSWIEVEIEQDETVVFQTVVLSSFPSTSISGISGECTIRCTTDGGAVYEGTIVL